MKPEEKKHARIDIHNEDDGRDAHINADREQTIDSVIAEFYEKKLKREQLPGDRLRCESDGEDILPHRAMTVGAFLAAGHCTGLSWLFAGDTGGAAVH